MRLVHLTKGHVAFVDDQDYEQVSAFEWCAQVIEGNVYAARRSGRSYVYMHRVLTKARRGQQVHHWNGDGLDNRRGNLHLGSAQDNQRSFKRKAKGKTSRFRGVSWNRAKGLWEAKITVDYKQLHLRRYRREEDAAKAYDAAAREHFGAMAHPNFPAFPA